MLRCHNYRKIKLKELEIHQIITLLIQDIGSDYLLSIVLERMESDIMEEDDGDGSSFLESIQFFNNQIFKRNPEFSKSVISLIERKRFEIENVLGSNRVDRILDKLKEKSRV